MQQMELSEREAETARKLGYKPRRQDCGAWVVSIPEADIAAFTEAMTRAYADLQ